MSMFLTSLLILISQSHMNNAKSLQTLFSKKFKESLINLKDLETSLHSLVLMFAVISKCRLMKSLLPMLLTLKFWQWMLLMNFVHLSQLLPQKVNQPMTLQRDFMACMLKVLSKGNSNLFSQISLPQLKLYQLFVMARLTTVSSKTSLLRLLMLFHSRNGSKN